MTLILVLLCLAIAGRELYLAFDKRLPRLQSKVEALQDRVGRLTNEFDRFKEEPRQDAPAGEEPRPAGPPQVMSGVSPTALSERPPPGGGPLTDRPVAGRAAETLPDLPADPARTGSVEELRAQVERLDRELEEAAERLAELENEREAQRALARSLDSVEEVVTELRRDMLDRLERESDTVRGLLLGDEPEDEPTLSAAYERCVAEHGLRVRVRESAMDRPWYTGYYLSGRRPDEASKELLALARTLRGPHDTSALSALLVGLGDMRAGVARVGSFTAVRTVQGLSCGILPENDVTDPETAAARIRELPAVFRYDLTWLYTTAE